MTARREAVSANTKLAPLRRRAIAYPIFIAVGIDLLLRGRALSATGWAILPALVYLTALATLMRFAFFQRPRRENWLGVPFLGLGLLGAMRSIGPLNIYMPNSFWWAVGGTLLSVLLASLSGEFWIRAMQRGEPEQVESSVGGGSESVG